MKTKILIFGILILFSLNFVSASCTQDNIFTLNSDKILCGYCQYKENNSLCGASVNCSLSVYYQNKTIILDNQNMTNAGDGSFTYNITSLNLTSRDYIGLQNCDKNEYDGYSIFEIEILPATVTQQMGGGSVYVYQSDLDRLKQEINITKQVEEKNMIQDFKGVIKDTANWIYPKNLFIGGLIILSLLIIFIFSREVIKFLRKRKIKVREEI